MLYLSSRLLQVTKIPEQPCIEGEAGYGGVLPIDECMRAVLFGIIERDRFFQMFVGRY